MKKSKLTRTIFFTEEELKEIETKADNERMKLNEYIKSTSLRDEKRRQQLEHTRRKIHNAIIAVMIANQILLTIAIVLILRYLRGFN